ncbi:MAG: glycosyltransferase family 4 protein [Moorea sp. SIO4A3]|nr:glycosyltransferase family 4 protein [Moorena sp. SIO4A3]
MMFSQIKVLLIIEQCNPEWPSVPLLAYKYFEKISQIVDVTLVTHERNKEALEKSRENTHKIVYFSESKFSKLYYSFLGKITTIRGRINWPLLHTLSYPIYEEFNHLVYKKFRRQILNGDYDVVHALTPIMPRYPVKAIKACKQTPFLLGPVNGGVPFPEGFQKIAKKEYAHLNFLRAIGRYFIPGYVATYKKADKILAGSTYTLNMLKDLFKIPDDKIELFYENGISQDFLTQVSTRSNGNKLHLLFVGRLVPYKCPDIVIEAISKLDKSIKNKIQLTIVGDGSEKDNLLNRVQELGLEKVVNLVGWVTQQETLEYYRKSDIFCFPSIREFGGAVVLEAMACGLPCIVANNGGIGEYVTEETGFKIEPISREYLTKELTNKIQVLATDEELRKKMSAKSIERVQEFEWSNKAKQIVNVYHQMISKKLSDR